MRPRCGSWGFVVAPSCQGDQVMHPGRWSRQEKGRPVITAAREDRWVRAWLTALGRVYALALASSRVPEPTSWRGRSVDARGKVHRVWACDGHTDGLMGARRLPSQ